MTTSTKLCIDCMHCTASSLEQSQRSTPMCMKGARSPVDGSYVDRCEKQRDMHGAFGPICGLAGDWWEPRAKANTGATP